LATPIEPGAGADGDPTEPASVIGKRLGESGILSSQDDRRGPATVEQANSLGACSPRVALDNPTIARLLSHYIDSLAPWYDLNESSLVFGTIVPLHALGCPVLFKALVAFAATHRYKTSGQSEDIATAFHAACVRELLDSLKHVKTESQGDYLAATCLLRSYEILNGIISRLFS
jgi:hypothetical protein